MAGTSATSGISRHLSVWHQIKLFSHRVQYSLHGCTFLDSPRNGCTAGHQDVPPGFFWGDTARCLHIHMNNAGAVLVLAELLHNEGFEFVGLQLFLKTGSVI
jgi:hypothetical protein